MNVVSEGIPLELYPAHAHTAGAWFRQLPSEAAVISQKTQFLLEVVTCLKIDYNTFYSRTAGMASGETPRVSFVP